MKKIVCFVILIILTINLSAQDSKIDRFSYSLYWTPIYYGPNDGEFRLDAILPLAFETNINYMIIKRISVSSGIGYQNWNSSHVGGWESIFDPTKSINFQSNTLRIPFQISYQLTKNKLKINPYLKTEIVKEFGFHRTRYYQDDILYDSHSYKIYSTTLHFGIGNLSNISKSIMLLTECSIGTFVYRDPFDSYQIKFKLGILIK